VGGGERRRRGPNTGEGEEEVVEGEKGGRVGGGGRGGRG